MASKDPTPEIKVEDLRFQLPGLTLPLNWTLPPPFSTNTQKTGAQGQPPNTARCPNALDCDEGSSQLGLPTLREFKMMQFMASITDKPDWHVKVFNDEIAGKWKGEARRADGDFTENMGNYCIDELRWKVEKFKETGLICALQDGIFKSDVAISESLNKRLRDAVRPLEDVPPKLKDYHPHSDDKVVDLVHPSLFPLVYGRSRVLRDKIIGLKDSIGACGMGDIIPVPSENEAQIKPKYAYFYSLFSRKFQWLPCEVQFEPDEAAPDAESNPQPPKCKITSYINNLHPNRHTELYDIIAEIISCAVPLWNRTLMHLLDFTLYSPRIKFDAVEYDADEEEDSSKPEQRDDEEEDDYWERYEAWQRDFRAEHLVIPDAGEFQPPESPKAGRLKEQHEFTGLQNTFKSTFQVIVKLANIELTPEKPEYSGGTWHVEGQINEHICATALYYYSSENITESRLAFRQQSEDRTIDISYEQNDSTWLSPIFGCEDNGPVLQEIGSVVCREGRLLTFPNTLQHRVTPFKLADPSKPGHRKILALFLVDPNIRIISTANVPPQQRDWWSEKLWMVGVLGGLSREMHDEVMNNVDDFPIGMEDAKKLRLELMEERSGLEALQKDCFERAQTFSLCEH